MATPPAKHVDPLVSGLTSMYRAANYGANASILTVSQLRDVINQVHYNFNSAKAAWLDLVSLVGATDARELLASRLSPTPADINAALAGIQSSALSLLDAYQGSAYGSGTPAWSYSYTVVDGLLDGGHSDVQITSGVLTAVNTFCATLRTSLLELAPVE